jgi:hypothetical protein
MVEAGRGNEMSFTYTLWYCVGQGLLPKPTHNRLQEPRTHVKIAIFSSKRPEVASYPGS